MRVRCRMCEEMFWELKGPGERGAESWTFYGGNRNQYIESLPCMVECFITALFGNMFTTSFFFFVADFPLCFCFMSTGADRLMLGSFYGKRCSYCPLWFLFFANSYLSQYWKQWARNENNDRCVLLWLLVCGRYTVNYYGESEESLR